MKEKLANKFVKVLSIEHGLRVINLFNKVGCNCNGLTGESIDNYYGLEYNGRCITRHECLERGFEEITVEQLEEIVNQKEEKLLTKIL